MKKDGKNILGIEIGGTKIQLLLQNSSREEVSRRRFSVNAKAGAHGILKQLKEGILSILAAGEGIDVIGIGFGGPVDRDSGLIVQSSHINGWNGFSLVEWANTVIKCPVFVDNDANVAALGEAVRGAGIPFESVFYVTIGSGVGGGLIRNGHIVYGKRPGESEIGLTRLDIEGNTLQSLASGWGIDEQIRKKLTNYPHSILTELSQKYPGNEARHLGPALLQKDPFAQSILNDTTEYLALAFSHIIHLIHPDALIIGGGVSKLGEPLRKAIENNLSKFVTKAFQPLPPLLLSGLGEDVVPVGAIELARQNLA